tara:strand:- start:260518 stop:262926 length:2409 start_codon:yes stop_codon:yes gene_type:complete
MIQTPFTEKKMIERAREQAIKAIPPLWPLTNSVAVNPFLGQSHLPFSDAAAMLARISGNRLTLSRTWYLDKINSGHITDQDLKAAMQEPAHAGSAVTRSELARDTSAFKANEHMRATLASLATKQSGLGWNSLIEDRLGAWASAYFDEGQALWPMTAGKGAWASWLSWAQHDLTPEVFGLKNFAKRVQALPEDPDVYICQARAALQIPSAHLGDYFHQLLLGLGGWSQLARYQLWQAELDERDDHTLRDLLAIRLVWDVALYEQYESHIGGKWSAIWEADSHSDTLPEGLREDLVLHSAFEQSKIRRLDRVLRSPQRRKRETETLVQAVFCIDVRSEVFRRALERVSGRIETRGFAGFFGIPLELQGFASDIKENRLPVLLKPSVRASARPVKGARDDKSERYRGRALRAWGRFRMAAVSSFAFVESSGPIYAWRLARDGLAGAKKKPVKNHPLQLDPAIDTASRVNMAKSILTAMSMTEGFAPIVLLVGHGAKVTNNPHASALHCGACGGHAGDVNVRLLAQILNDPVVRSGLVAHDILIPDATLFLGALHTTTSDEIEIFDDAILPSHHTSVAQLKTWLTDAGRLARRERSNTLPRANRGKGIIKRTRDWAETRPEWGLANCGAFIAAPRERTRDRNLSGTAFLHEYDWKKDPEFATLELILTAPVVVASWISLQYFGSVVAPELFGSGNKLLHNVVGGIGVLEGNGGQLRTGLPYQSVHDGEKYVHEPTRLAVCIEAPCEAIAGILEKHEKVRDLFDNAWLRLFTLNENGGLAYEYVGNLGWRTFERSGSEDQLEAVAT